MRLFRLRAAVALAVTSTGVLLAVPGVARAAGAVTPTVACSFANGDGTKTLSVGYTNTTGSAQTYAVGTSNFVTPAPQGRGQPTAFATGTHSGVWAVTLSAADISAGPSWTVNGTAVALTSATACSSKPAGASGTVTPFVTCAWNNGDGTYTFSLGYTNTAATATTIAAGSSNAITVGAVNQGQPTTFATGSNTNAWALTATSANVTAGEAWQVNGDTATLTLATTCPSKPVSVDGTIVGYLGATAAVIGIGAFFLISPRRRRALRTGETA